MNKKAIQNTIDLMKSGDSRFKFNMSKVYVRTSDGAEMCIAGYVNMANGCDYTVRYHTMRNASEILGIPFYNDSDEPKGVDLFSPGARGLGGPLYSYQDITIEHGIDMLERLRDTGVIDWKPVVEKILASR